MYCKLSKMTYINQLAEVLEVWIVKVNEGVLEGSDQHMGPY